MCYENPQASPVAYLLDKSSWEHLADALNTALLGIINPVMSIEHRILNTSLHKLLELSDKQAESLLEKSYKQTVLAHKELMDLNLGSAALINVDRDCLLP